MVSNLTWSPDGADPQRQYLNWWYAHIPHFRGLGRDSHLNNWWRYITDVDQFKNGDDSLPYAQDAPTVTLKAPTNGSPVSGLVTVKADATVYGALGRVDLYVDDVYYATDNLGPFTFQWDTTRFAAGAHILVARAYELQSGAEGVSAPVLVTI